MEIKRSNGTVVTVKDPLDFAYWIMGVKNALASGQIDTGEWDGGEMDFIQSAMDHVGVIDQLWNETNFKEEGCPTVWVYELVEPLGQVCAEFLWAGRSSDQVHEALLEEGRRMIKEFSGPDEDANPVNEWTEEDSKAAQAEGWDVFHVNNDQFEIQRCDEAGILQGDAPAVYKIYDKALRGSALHRKALAIVLAESNIRSKT